MYEKLLTNFRDACDKTQFFSLAQISNRAQNATAHPGALRPHPFPFALHLLVREQINKSGVRTQRYVVDLHDLTGDWKSMECGLRPIALL